MIVLPYMLDPRPPLTKQPQVPPEAECSSATWESGGALAAAVMRAPGQIEGLGLEGSSL